MSGTEENRFAAPLAEVADVAPSHQAGTLAGRGSRLGAAMIDGVITVSALGAVALLTPFNLFVTDPAQGLWLAMARNMLVGFACFLLFHGYLLATHGQTIGKMLVKIRIVRTDGSRASFARLVGLRSLVNSLITVIPVAGALYGMVDALFIFRAERRCVHDLIADTVVVQA